MVLVASSSPCPPCHRLPAGCAPAAPALARPRDTPSPCPAPRTAPAVSAVRMLPLLFTGWLFSPVSLPDSELRSSPSLFFYTPSFSLSLMKLSEREIKKTIPIPKVTLLLYFFRAVLVLFPSPDGTQGSEVCICLVLCSTSSTNGCNQCQQLLVR